uniref:Ig-like domain-containing protein n=1 Tax=Pundamilia nyererei TaxID=303518 RepID=A0A3B4GU93_9CICH
MAILLFTGFLGEEKWMEFVGVAVVNGFEVIYCSKNSMTAETRQDWVKEVIQYHPTYWFTNECRESQSLLSLNIEALMKSFNHTKGVHTFQRMSGCEWDDETGEVNGFNQFGYDGEDFITFDLKTDTWIPTNPQAVIFKQKWDNNREALYRERNNLITICPEMLKNFLNYGRTLLVKPVLPSFYLLQKTPSSPVTCHATGFNPNKVNMVWRKDGAEIHEGVNRGEIIPNNDWTFQMSVDLEISSVRPEDWERYACVFQFSDVNQDIVTKLDKAVIWTNKGKIESRWILFACLIKKNNIFVQSSSEGFIYLFISFSYVAIFAFRKAAPD